MHCVITFLLFHPIKEEERDRDMNTQLLCSNLFFYIIDTFILLQKIGFPVHIYTYFVIWMSMQGYICLDTHTHVYVHMFMSVLTHIYTRHTFTHLIFKISTCCLKNQSSLVCATFGHVIIKLHASVTNVQFILVYLCTFPLAEFL